MADHSAPTGTGACIAKAIGLGYGPLNSVVLQLWTGKHLLILLLTGIAHDMM